LSIDKRLLLDQHIIRKSAIRAVEDVTQENKLALAEIMSPR
jgi:hypothetical protein